MSKSISSIVDYLKVPNLTYLVGEVHYKNMYVYKLNHNLHSVIYIFMDKRIKYIVWAFFY